MGPVVAAHSLFVAVWKHRMVSYNLYSSRAQVHDKYQFLWLSVGGSCDTAVVALAGTLGTGFES